LAEYTEGYTEELVDQIPDEYKSPNIQISMRISKEILAKCAILTKKYDLTVPNPRTPEGKYIYHRFVRMLFLTLLDSYFLPHDGKDPVCMPPLSAEEINKLIFLLNENKLDEPIPVSLGTPDSELNELDVPEINDIVSGIDDL
jgi:hypothetical protein